MYMNELYHYGVKGMKWGVRRTISKLTDKSIRQGKGRDNISPGEKILKDTSSVANDINSMINKSRGKKNKQDTSDISDADLQKMIKRLELEKKYKDLSSKDVDSGRTTANDVLEIIGGITGIVGTSVGIAATIKALLKE